MSKRLLIILLFVSLAFNLAVLGSVIWLHTHIPAPPPPPHNHHERSRLPEHLDNLPWDPQLKELRKAYDQDRILLMRELAKADYSEARAQTLIDSSLTDQGHLEKALASRLLNLRRQMSAAEAQEYFENRAEQIELRSNRFSNMHERRKKNEENNRNKPHPDGSNGRPARSKGR